jgi:hypothetical protein
LRDSSTRHDGQLASCPLTKNKNGIFIHYTPIMEVTVRHDNMTGPKMVEFDAAYADNFRRLNLVWRERYFRVEPIDVAVLSYPEERIIKPVV